MTYKERAAQPAQPHLLRALTAEEKARPGCRWFHRWELLVAVNTWHYLYWQCRKCCDRRASYRYSGGHAPSNFDWLQGRAWDHHALNPPTTRGPVSAVQPPTPESTQVTLHEGSRPPS